MNKLILNYSQNENKLKKEHNSSLITIMVLIGVLTVVGSLLITMIPSKLCHFCGNSGHIALELFLVFIGIGIVEVFFFTNVASKYVPSSVGGVLEVIKEKLTSKFA